MTQVAEDASNAAKEKDKRACLEDSVLDSFGTLYTSVVDWKAATNDDITTKFKAVLKPNQTITLMRHRFYSLSQFSNFDNFYNPCQKEGCIL